MPDETNLPPLTLPGLRARMGDRVYYITCMRLGDLRDRVSEVPLIHESKTLSDLIQREIQDGHAAKIASYLRPDNEERFFSALVIGVYGGAPEWYELAVRGNMEHPDGPGEELDGIVGYLKLNGTEKLFAIDGQHRVVGIKQALKQKPELASDEVSVLFVAHKETTEGRQRTRRLFTTLNRYAKPVGEMEKIALDEDDVVAITVRRLMEEYPLLKDRLSLSKTRSLSTSDTKSLTTVETLYKALDSFLKPKSPRGWSEYLRKRPDDTTLDAFYERATQLWEAIERHCPELHTFSTTTDTATASASYRHIAGGHLLFRPIGLDIIFRAIRHRMDEDITLEDAVTAVFQVPMDLTDALWSHVLWNPVLEKMMNSPSKTVAVALMHQASGGQLKTIRRDDVWLAKELAGLRDTATTGE